jgi:hypothetical protein
MTSLMSGQAGCGWFDLTTRLAAAEISRIACDAIDLAVLGSVLVTGRNRNGAAIAGIAVLGVTLLDFLCARQLSAEPTQIGRHPARFGLAAASIEQARS